MKIIFRVFNYAFWGGVLFSVLIAGYLGWSLYAPLPGQPTQTTVQIPAGASYRELLHQLSKDGWEIQHFPLIVYARLTGVDQKIPSGEIHLEDCCASAVDLLQTLVAGRPVLLSWTLVEGWTFKQVMRSLQGLEGVTLTLKGYDSCDIGQHLSQGYCLEGLLLPDTYLFAEGTSDKALLLRARDSQQTFLEEHWNKRNPRIPLDDFYQALTLASIVEKEARVREEMDTIAGVYLNRLAIDMKLEADPTVLYGRQAGDGTPITGTQLRDKNNVYNTYQHKGLPPTPIAMPGREAITAVFHPASTPYFFFVAAADGSGRHLFSKDLKEHREKVKLVRALKRTQE